MLVMCWEEHIRRKQRDTENKRASSQPLHLAGGCRTCGAEGVEVVFGSQLAWGTLKALKPQPAMASWHAAPFTHKPQAGQLL